MANIFPRKNKDGVITSYTIRVSRGYDGFGRRLKPYTLTYKPSPNMTPKQIEKELNKTAVMFEEQCRLGYSHNNKQTFAQYAEYVLKRKEESGVKHRTLVRYNELLIRINAGIGHIKLVDLRPQHLTELYSQLRKPGLRKNSSKATLTYDLKFALKEKQITLIKLSEASGVSLSSINTILKYKPVSYAKAEAVCKALNCNMEKLFKIHKDNRPLSEKTVLEHHRLISAILTYAEKEMLIPYNSASKIVDKPKATQTHKVNYFESDDLERIRDCLSKESLKWQVITHLLIVTGCRRGEIMGLKWSAIDFEKNEMKISNNLLYSKDYGIYQDTTKTETSSRTIKLTPETAELLMEYRQWWEDIREKCGSAWNHFISISDGKGVMHSEKANFLFFQEKTSLLGYPMHPDSITDWLSKFSAKHNLPHINPHAFRHTLASVLCLNGIDMTTISKWLGHKNVTTTMNIYEHILDKGKEQVADCVADVILRKKA